MPSRRPIRNIGRRASTISPTRFTPILDEFDKVERQLRAWKCTRPRSPSTSPRAQRAIEAVKGHKRFGFNYDPSHLGYQHVDYVKFIRTFAANRQDRIFHVHMKDAWWGHGDGTVGVFGGHTTFADPRRYWDFRSPGPRRREVRRDHRRPQRHRLSGPASASNGKTAGWTASTAPTEAAAFVKKIDFKPSAIAFDAQFDR